MSNRRPKTNSGGFTLLELVMTIAIIGVLATITMNRYKKFQSRSKQSEAKINLNTIHAAKQINFAESNTFVCGFCGCVHLCANKETK